MELTDVLAARRTTRTWSDAEVTDADLHRVLTAGLAMPHAGNTYDWRVLVLRHGARTQPNWAAVHSSLMNQDYLAEAPVVAVFTVAPRWWAARYAGNVTALLDAGTLQAHRHGDLLAHLDAGIGGEQLRTLLIGEAMMAVAASVLTATDLGLGTALALCRPAELHAALDLPAEVEVCPTGVLALGWPGSAAPPRADKPPAEELLYLDRWGRT